MIDISDRAQLGLVKLADLWFPGSATSPRMSRLQDFQTLVARALEADENLARSLVEIAELAAEAPNLSHEMFDDWPATSVEEALLVASAAYYMSAEVRRAIGYPGQIRMPVSEASPDEFVDPDLLQPVIDRGPIYVSPPET